MIVDTRLAETEGLIPDNPVANGNVFGPASGAVTVWMRFCDDTWLAVSKLLKSGNSLCVIGHAWCTLSMLLGWLFLDISNLVAWTSNRNGSWTDCRKHARRFGIVHVIFQNKQTGKWKNICKVTETHFSGKSTFCYIKQSEKENKEKQISYDLNCYNTSIGNDFFISAEIIALYIYIYIYIHTYIHYITI